MKSTIQSTGAAKYKVYPQSIILDSGNNVIGAVDSGSDYFVFKLGFGQTSTSSVQIVSNSKVNHAYAIVSDGSNGYYASGFVDVPSGKKTGLQFAYYSSTFSRIWEIAPYDWGADFEQSIFYLSLNSGSLWGCGYCQDCVNSQNKALFSRLNVQASTPLNTDLEAMTILNTKQGCLGITGMSDNTAYGISKYDSVYKIHKINLGSTRNSWTSSRFSFSGQTQGFTEIDINMGQFVMIGGTPYIYYVGKLKNYLGKGGSDYSNDAGFLMKMMAAPGTYDSETCGSYTISAFISDVISSSYTLTNDQSKIIVITSSSTGSIQFSMSSGSSQSFSSSSQTISNTNTTPAGNRFSCPLSITSTTSTPSSFTYDWVLKTGDSSKVATDFNTFVCTGSTFTYNPTYLIAQTSLSSHDISFTSPLTFTWSTASKKQTVDITLTGTLPDSRTSKFLFKVIITNQCEAATTLGPGSGMNQDYIVTTPQNPQLSFQIGTFSTNPIGCPLTYTFDVSVSGTTQLTSVTSTSIFSIIVPTQVIPPTLQPMPTFTIGPTSDITNIKTYTITIKAKGQHNTGTGSTATQTLTANLKTSCTIATIQLAVTDVQITYQIPNSKFSTTLSPFTIGNVPAGINCYNYYIMDLTLDSAPSPSVAGWVEFTSLTSLILNVGPKQNGYTINKVSTLEKYRIKAVNVEVPSQILFVPLDITVKHECTSTTLDQITLPAPITSYSNTVLQPLISKNIISPIPEKLFSFTQPFTAPPNCVQFELYDNQATQVAITSTNPDRFASFTQPSTLKIGSLMPNSLVKSPSGTFTYNIKAKIKMDTYDWISTPITVTIYHECYGYSIAASSLPIVIDYTDQKSSITVPIFSAFTITPSSPVAPSYCFEKTVSLANLETPALTPTPITYNTGITLSSDETNLNIASKTYASLAVGKMTEYGTVSAVSILTGSVAVHQTMKFNYYHRCYTATITATASETSASYTVAKNVNSLDFGTFTSFVPGSSSTSCALDFTLWYSNGTQVLSTDQSAFKFPQSSSDLTTVEVIYQADNFNVAATPYSLVLKAAVRYGTKVAQLSGTYEIKGNPCLTASVTLPTTPSPTVSTLVLVNGPFIVTINPSVPFVVTEGSPVPATSCISYKFYDTDLTKVTVPNYLKMSYPDITLIKTSAGTLSVKQWTQNYKIGGQNTGILGTTEIFADLTVIVNHECFSEILSGPPLATLTFNYVISDPLQYLYLTKNSSFTNQFQPGSANCKIIYELYETVAGIDSLVSGSLASLVNIDATDQIFYIQYSTDNSLIGPHSLKVRAYLEFGEDLIQDKYLNIILNVKHQCTKATLAYKSGYGGTNYFMTQYIDQQASVSTLVDVFDIYDAGLSSCIQFTWDINAISIPQATFVPSQQKIDYQADSTAFSTPFQTILTGIKVDVLNYGSVYQLHNLVNMTVFHKCYFENLTNLGNFTQPYLLGDSSKTFPIPTFYSSSCALIETLQWPNGTALTLNPFFTFSTGPSYSWTIISTTDPSFIGKQEILYKAQMAMGLSSGQTWIILDIQCATLWLKPNPIDLYDFKYQIMKEQTYTIGDSRTRFYFNNFQTAIYCGIPTVYKFTLQSGEQLPKFMFGGTNVITKQGFIEVYSNTRKDAFSLNWQIMVTGIAEIGNPPNETEKYRTTIILPLTIIIPNLGPPTLKAPPSDVKLIVGDSFQLRLLPYSDPDAEDRPIFNEPDFGLAASFISGQYPSYMIIPKNNETDWGVFDVSFSIIDDNPEPKKSVYSFKITVIPLGPVKELPFDVRAAGPKNRTTPSLKLIVKIKSISNQGIATISFSQSLLIPANISSIDDKVLQVEVKPGKDSEAKYLKINSWNITKFTKTSMDIKLNFESPLRISLQTSQLDSLSIKFLLPEFFMEADTGDSVKQDLIVTKDIPRQLHKDGATTMLLSQGASTKTTMTSMMYGNLAVNVLMSASLQMLWGMVNVMQLVIKLPLLNINFPQNAAIFYTFISDVASFDLLPMDKINEKIFHFSQNETEDANFDLMGYQSDNIIKNLGSMVVYLVGFFLLVLIAILLKSFKDKFETIKIVYDHLAKMIFWNMILRMILEGYIEYSISSILNVRDMVWITKSDKISSAFAIVILTVVLVFPFFMWALLWSKFSILGQEKAINVFGSTYQELRTDSKPALLYNVIYMLRRLLIAVIVTMLKDYSFFQVQAIVLHSLAVIIYTAWVRPFEVPMMNTIEIFNELCILLATCHLFIFTAFVDSPEIQYKLGWTLIGVSVLNMAVNILVMVKASFRQLKLLFRKLLYKYRQWRNKDKLIQKSKAQINPSSPEQKKPKKGNKKGKKGKINNDISVVDLENNTPSGSTVHNTQENLMNSQKVSKSIKSRRVKQDEGGTALPKKKRVHTLDEIRREYNKGIGEFKNFQEYQDYMADRDQQVQKIQSMFKNNPPGGPSDAPDSSFFDKYGRPKMLDDDKPDDMKVVFDMNFHPHKSQDDDVISNQTNDVGFSPNSTQYRLDNIQEGTKEVSSQELFQKNQKLNNQNLTKELAQGGTSSKTLFEKHNLPKPTKKNKTTSEKFSIQEKQRQVILNVLNNTQQPPRAPSSSQQQSSKDQGKVLKQQKEPEEKEEEEKYDFTISDHRLKKKKS